MPIFTPIASRPISSPTVSFLPVGKTVSSGVLVVNGNMERVPTFVAATTTAGRWVDGTAAGSNATSSAYGFCTFTQAGTVATQFDASVSHGGTASLKLSTLATGSQIVVSNFKNAGNVLGNAIKLKPSAKYRLTVWMKTLANSGSAATGARLACNERTPTGTFVAGGNYAGVPTTTDWTKYTINYTATSATNNYLDIQPSVTGNNGTSTLIMDAWFDDIVLTIV